MLPEPIATYRLQLRPDFGFADAAEQVSYLAELGVSHIYTSPYLQAASGSTHGYDVVDPTKVNTELGGEQEHRRFCRTLKSAGLGHMIDLVPNHMAILGRENPWWWDVLENGPSSPFAVFFDVDWESSEDRWPNKVMLPILGDHYGRVLEAGELKLVHENNLFTINYFDQIFPVDPSSLGHLLSSAAHAGNSDLLGFIANCCDHLPRPTVTGRQAIRRRHRDKSVIQKLLAEIFHDKDLQALIDAEVEKINKDADALDALIEKQNYRLALWRAAGRDLGYRRFFDINDLVGLRVEDKEVFMTTHSLPLSWVRKKMVQGLRVDHPDGLRDPAGYFQRLREQCPDVWILAEKILEPQEELAHDWPVQGTTGYDFLNLAGNLFIDPRGKKPLTDLFTRLTGESPDYPSLLKKCKGHIIKESLGSDLKRLTALFVDVCEHHRRHRDYTREELENALFHVAVAFPVYRTYVKAKPGPQKNNSPQLKVNQSDIHYIKQAVKKAESDVPGLDPELLKFLEKILLLEISGTLEGELAMRFQQFTGPVMAKGMEDTAFYRFNRLICLNEVGGDPGSFGISTDDFHNQGKLAQAKRPLSLLAGSTHDTKRGEDVRARLALLSELPDSWGRAVKSWFAQNRKYHVNKLPDPNFEYFIYQTLVGAWPISEERLRIYLEKAMREAKLRTSWTRQDMEYEESVQEFARAILNDKNFHDQMEDFLKPLIAAGRINSLSQTLLRLTFPGVPDIYQGCELWDMSLVDPDNRRPVDFSLRNKLLAELSNLSPDRILARMEEGLPKLWLIRQALRLRRSRPESFGPESSYQPMYARGKKAQHVLAFQRGEEIITIIPRLLTGLKKNWQDTGLELPPGSWNNTLTGEQFNQGSIKLSRLLAKFPVALLAKEG
jgi:(1->4)-alpha-D-glucan 1-alpha-D-glucosylmutase